MCIILVAMSTVHLCCYNDKMCGAMVSTLESQPKSSDFDSFTLNHCCLMRLPAASAPSSTLLCLYTLGKKCGKLYTVVKFVSIFQVIRRCP